MSKEAMKLALEALGQLWLFGDEAAVIANPAITALREALAKQPAQQEPVAWKLVPTEPTEEMLKAMDECSKEGYDERLYAGHAASVYMAAVDAAPTQPAQRKPLTDEEIDAEFEAFASKFSHESNEWLDMGADAYFRAGFKTANGIKENT